MIASMFRTISVDGFSFGVDQSLFRRFTASVPSTFGISPVL